MEADNYPCWFNSTPGQQKNILPAIPGRPTESEVVAAMEQLMLVERGAWLYMLLCGPRETQVSSGETDFLAGYINHHAANLRY